MSWSRAQSEVLHGRADALVGVGKNEVPELILPAIPQGIASYNFLIYLNINGTTQTALKLS